MGRRSRYLRSSREHASFRRREPLVETQIYRQPPPRRYSPYRSENIIDDLEENLYLEKQEKQRTQMAFSEQVDDLKKENAKLKANMETLQTNHSQEIDELRRQWEITTRDRIKEQLLQVTSKLNMDRQNQELVNKLGLYHCDIKSENFLVEFKKLKIKVIDFGVSLQLLTKQNYLQYSKGCSPWILPFHLQDSGKDGSFWKIQFGQKDLCSLDLFALTKMFFVLLQKDKKSIKAVNFTNNTEKKMLQYIEQLQKDYKISNRIANLIKYFLIGGMSKNLKQMKCQLSTLGTNDGRKDKKRELALNFEKRVTQMKELVAASDGGELKKFESVESCIKIILRIYQAKDSTDKYQNINMAREYIKSNTNDLGDSKVLMFLSWVSYLYLELCKIDCRYYANVSPLVQKVIEVLEKLNQQEIVKNSAFPFYIFQTIEQMGMMRISEYWQNKLKSLIGLNKPDIKADYSEFKEKDYKDLKQVLQLETNGLKVVEQNYFTFYLDQQNNSVKEANKLNMAIKKFVGGIEILYEERKYQEVIDQSKKVFQYLISIGKLGKSDDIYTNTLKSFIRIGNERGRQEFFQSLKQWIYSKKTKILMLPGFKEVQELFVVENLHHVESLKLLFETLKLFLSDEFLKQNWDLQRGRRLMVIYNDILKAKNNSLINDVQKESQDLRIQETRKHMNILVVILNEDIQSKLNNKEGVKFQQLEEYLFAFIADMIDYNFHEQVETCKGLLKEIFRDQNSKELRCRIVFQLYSQSLEFTKDAGYFENDQNLLQQTLCFWKQVLPRDFTYLSRYYSCIKDKSGKFQQVMSGVIKEQFNGSELQDMSSTRKYEDGEKEFNQLMHQLKQWQAEHQFIEVCYPGLLEKIQSYNGNLVSLYTFSANEIVIEELGFSWFHLAIRVNNGNLIVDLIRKFHEEGILKQEVNNPDNHGNTPLHKMTLTGMVVMVNVLCEAGTDINALNQSKQTALFYAAAKVDDNKEGTQPYKDTYYYLQSQMSQDTIFLRDINGITAEDIKEAEDSYWTIENMNK